MYIDLDYILLRSKRSDIEAITSDKNTAKDEINENIINAVITDSCAIIDNVLNQAGYVTPVTQPSDFLKVLTFDLFCYRLFSRKYKDEELKDLFVRYTAANARLKEIRDGLLKLNDLALETIGEIQTCILTNKTDSDQVFIKSDLEQM